MALQFAGTSPEIINFGDICNSVADKLIMFWLVRDDASRGKVFFKGDSSEFKWTSSFEDPGAGGMYIFWGQRFTGAVGIWRGSTNLSSGLYHFAIQYDWSSASNDPRIWVNGSLETITEIFTPSGTAVEGTGKDFTLGDDIITDSLYAFKGKMLSLTINNIASMSDAEVETVVANAYASRKTIPFYGGLVLAPNLLGAAGGKKDGETLAAGNTIRDLVTGTDGVPSGSPIFKEETILSLGGE